MRLIAAWAVLMIASGAFIAMMLSTYRQASTGTGGRRNAVELVWSLIPWVIVALCVTPSAIGP
jgi:heme/copper-type cytochrome/quinol oxidase subunit 2